jgi:hypothetical protein
MKLIQFILIPVFVIAMVIYVRRFRTILLDRLIAILMGLVAILLILNPDWTANLAREFGVGRGTDLMLYLSVTGLGFFCLTLWAKLQDMEARLTQIIRTQALAEASQVSPEKSEKK